MLVLTRKTQERIHIGDNITISILKLKGNTVRIGIEAPRDVRVLRGELPTFDGTFEVEVGETDAPPVADAGRTPTAGESEQSDDEPTVSELEWQVLKRISGRRQPCLPVRRCRPEQSAAATPEHVVRATSHVVSSVAVSD